jgi:hypothetical protein
MRSSANVLATEAEMKRLHGSKVISEIRRWKPLYTIAAYAALTIVFFMPVQMIIYFIWPPPETVTGWFWLFQQNAIIGLLDMDLLLSLDYLLLAMVYLALYVALKRYEPSLMAVALVLQLLAISIYFASTSAFEMLTLSSLYEAAPTEEEKAQLLAAGQAVLAGWQGTAFNMSYILGGLSLIIASIVMYRTDMFRKTISRLGIIMGILMLVPPTIGKAGVIISLLSLIPLLPWLVLLAQRFFILKDESPTNLIQT